MISQCPHCSQPLKFSPPQMEKFHHALAALPAGRLLKFGCPKCRTPIQIDKEGELAERTGTAVADTPRPPVDPPGAPDLSWLSSDDNNEEQVLEDVPTAMVMLPDPAVREHICTVLKGQNLQIHCPANVDEAITALRFKSYSTVVYSTGYEGGPVEVHDFHKFMSGMSMDRRRNIAYILVGEDVTTLHDLQALALSANLLVNTRELQYFEKIFQKGMQGYESLFRSYITKLSRHNKI